MIPRTDLDSVNWRRHVICQRTFNRIGMHATSLLFVFTLLLLSFLLPPATAASVTLTFDLLEESPRSTMVGILSNESKIQGLFRFLPSVPSKPRFSFLSQDRTGHQRLFRLSEHEGQLTTAEPIDREELCPPEMDEMTCEMELDVAIQTPSLLHTVKVVVRLVDRNDHSPRFVKDNIQLRISEADGAGTEFSIPEAEDPDSGLFGTLDFRLVLDDPPSGTNGTPFHLRAQRTIDGTTELRLVLERNLDRETTDRYRMRVIARDAGNPVRTGSLLVDVIVTDVNDNPPRFVEPALDVSIAENLPNGTIIGVVKAVDRDSGSNGVVTFAFSRSTQNTVSGLFSVGPDSGEIRVTGAVDFERRRRYSLGIVASDGGSNPLSSHAVVTVHVTDVNDNSPRISVSPLTQSGFPEVRENADVGTFAAHISVTDPDTGPGGQWNCSLTGNPDFRLERIPEVSQNEFKLVSAVVFDREVAQLYHVTLTCADRGFPALTSSTDVEVRIVDENDEAPQFRLPVYSASVLENNRIGELIAEVSAFDRDLANNGEISYAISTGEISGVTPVTIDPKLGRIYANVAFDREVRDSYEFRVIASDAGLPVRSASVNFRLEVKDVNDESPRFSNRMFTFGTYENQPSGTEIGAVTAVDLDGPLYSAILYEIVGSSSDAFGIETTSGKITSLKSLDREAVPLYLLNVTAYNPDAPHLRDVTQVKVIVADRNDNTPRIRFPTPTNSTVHVSSRARIGDVIAAVDASDDDVGSNAALRYVIAGSHDNPTKPGLFAVDLLTGVVTVRRDLVNHADQSFSVVLVVHDEGQPRRSASVSLLVTVNSSLEAVLASSSRGQRGPIHLSTLTMVVASAGASCVVVIIAVVLFLVLRHRRQRPEVVTSRPEVGKMLPVAAESRGAAIRNENLLPNVKSNLLQYDLDSKPLQKEKMIDSKNRKNSNKNRKNWNKNKKNLNKNEDELREKQIAWLASYEDNLLQTYKQKNNTMAARRCTAATSPLPSNRTMPPPPPPPPPPPHSVSSLPSGHSRRLEETANEERYRGQTMVGGAGFRSSADHASLPSPYGCCGRHHAKPTPPLQSPDGLCLTVPLTDRSSDHGSVTDSGRGQSEDGEQLTTMTTMTLPQGRQFPLPGDHQLAPYAISPVGQPVRWTTKPTCINAGCRCEHAERQRHIWNRASSEQHRPVSQRPLTHDVTTPSELRMLGTATFPVGNTFCESAVHGRSTRTGSGSVHAATGSAGHMIRGGRKEEEEDGYMSDDATTTSGSYVLDNKDSNVWLEQRHQGGSSEASRV